MKKRIYLACPYSNYNEKEFIVREVTTLAASLYKVGYLVYSPLTMSYPMCQSLELPGDYSFWKDLDESFIEKWATEFWVAAYQGWNRSTGCYTEAVEAYKIELPLRKINPISFTLSNLQIHEFEV